MALNCFGWKRSIADWLNPSGFHFYEMRRKSKTLWSAMPSKTKLDKLTWTHREYQCMSHWNTWKTAVSFCIDDLINVHWDFRVRRNNWLKLTQSLNKPTTSGNPESRQVFIKAKLIIWGRHGARVPHVKDENHPRFTICIQPNVERQRTSAVMHVMSNWGHIKVTYSCSRQYDVAAIAGQGTASLNPSLFAS